MKTSSTLIAIDDEIELRQLTEKDAQVVFSLVNRNRVYLRTWLPWLDAIQSVEDESAFLGIAYANAQERNSLSCGIFHRGEFTGMISYHPIDWANRKTEIGYWLGAQFQGRGLMTKACRALVDYAFNELHLNKVEIRCAIGNERSRAIPQRLGFLQEGISRQAEWLYNHYVDLVLYGMLADEWQNHNHTASTRS